MPDRDTSVSKKVEGLHEEEIALDRKENLKEKFAAKEQDNRKPGLRPQGPERDGSKMVREDAPGMGPTPSGRMRVVPDRFAAARKLEAERKAAEIQTRAVDKAWRRLQDQQREGTEQAQDNEKKTNPVIYGNPQEREPGGDEKEKSTQETPEQAWERFQKRQQEIDRDLDQGRERERQQEKEPER